jgi:hypothetical protein
VGAAITTAAASKPTVNTFATINFTFVFVMTSSSKLLWAESFTACIELNTGSAASVARNLFLKMGWRKFGPKRGFQSLSEETACDILQVLRYAAPVTGRRMR